MCGFMCGELFKYQPAPVVRVRSFRPAFLWLTTVRALAASYAIASRTAVKVETNYTTNHPPERGAEI